MMVLQSSRTSRRRPVRIYHQSRLQLIAHRLSFQSLPSTKNHEHVPRCLQCHVAADSIFRCFNQASAYASVLNSVFAPSQYFYEVNKTYQMRGRNPNPPVCDAPRRPSHPNGDPEGASFKCHSGELYYEFGNIKRQGLPLRDENGLPISQFDLNSRAAFARSGNPNPDRTFLKAREYENTTWHLGEGGRVDTGEV